MKDAPATPELIERLIDAAGANYTAASARAVNLAEQALAAWQALPAAAQAAHPALQARCLRTHGLALDYAGRHAEGRAVLAAALAAVPEGDLAQRSSVLRALSIGCELLGAIDDAVDWATQALAAARAHGGSRLIADALLSLGVSYSRAGNAAAGLEQFEQVLALFEAAGERFGCMSVLNNMGINCKNLGRHADSVRHFEAALALTDSLNDTAAGAVVRTNLGEALLLIGRPEDARLALSAAVPALVATGNVDAETNARVNLGRVLLALGDAPAAQTELERALQLCHQTGGRNHAAPAHLTLAELHKRAGRFDLALHHHESFHAAERAQFNDASDRRIATLRVQLEVADARHEAELHQFKHVQIAKAHAELQQLHAALTAADTEKNLLLARLAEQTRTDALTGLANRRRLDEWLTNELALARRHGQPLAVAMCDLDFFKRINDQLGHAAGDTVLRTVARLLSERCRTTDLVARYGGEEFCIAFPQTGGDAAAQLCEALRDAVVAHDWAAVHPGLAVTVSIGISDQLALVSHERLLADADTHLYRAKRDGKNRVKWRGN